MTKKKNNSNTVYYLSAYEATKAQMPKYNPYACGHGVIGDTKYNRRKAEKQFRKDIDNA